MSVLGCPDLDRPITFASGRIYYAFGGGAFRLEPFRCTVLDGADGLVDFRLELNRALPEDDARALLSCRIGADYADEDALARVRQLDPAAALSSCELTHWWFRLLPSVALEAPPELAEPIVLAADGLGSARLMALLSIESGLLLEALLEQRSPLEGVAEAELAGVSPRAPVVVRFDSAELLAELAALADAAGALPRRFLVDYFGRDGASLEVSGDVSDASRPRIAEAMTDRVIARFGRYVPSRALEDAPVVQLDVSAPAASIAWSLSQPFLARRRIVMPIDLLAAAQQQVEQHGLSSVVQRRTLTSLPGLGRSRINVLSNLPTPRVGADALGVTLTFPPHPPHRPQPRSVTAMLEPAQDVATVDVMLSPGEPLRYAYASFAVVSDETGTQQLESPRTEHSGSPLRLSPEHFPIDFALIEVTPALAELATLTGVCSYELDGRRRERGFTLDSGQTSVSIAVPRQRASRIECVAIARDGSGSVRLGPFESARIRLDLTSFPTYGPQQIEVRCDFDDDASLRAADFLPIGLDESPDNVTTLSFTPTAPQRTFQWFSRSPFGPAFRYRVHASSGEWTAHERRTPLVLRSSELRAPETRREVHAGTATKKRAAAVHQLRGRLLESDPAAPVQEAAVEPVATSPDPTPTDELLYTRISDQAKLFVPRYVLDVQTVSGGQRYRITMAQRDASSTLEVNLVAAPAPSMTDAAREAREYPHSIAVQLDFLVAPPAGARKTLAFTDVTRAGNVVRAILTFATLAERDEVYLALTEPERGARLIVRRYIDVALPQRPPSGVRPPRAGTLSGVVLPARPTTYATKHTFAPRPAATTAIIAGGTNPSVFSPTVALSYHARTEAARSSIRGSDLVLATRPLAGHQLLRPVGGFVKSLPVPQLALVGKQDEERFTRFKLSVTNWSEYSGDFFAASPDLPPCGLNKSASRTWVDIHNADTGARLYGFCALSAPRQMADLWFAVPVGTAPPARVSVKLTDRRTKVVRESNAVATTMPQPDVPPYRAVRQELVQIVVPKPFAFSPALHAYMFEGLAPPAGTVGLIRHRFPWRGTFRTYLQDASRPAVVYFFPDEFKIARRRDTPFTPFVTVRVTSKPDASATDVVFDYVVAPYTDPKRLDEAEALLLADPRFAAERVEFQPFLTSDVRYFIDRPSESGTVREQRTDVALVLQNALKDTLTMSLPDFRLLFDAMHNRTASMFLGRVEIDVPNGDTEIVPFEARMDDLEGELFSYEAEATAEGSLRVTLRNEIESAVGIDTLDVTIQRDGVRTRGLIQGSPLPHENLLPGEALTLTIVPETTTDATMPVAVTFDLSGVRVRPDPAAIWDSILDRSTLEYFRFVTVKTVASSFEPLPGREEERIVSILVELEGGGTAELTASALEARVRIDHPIDDVILKRTVGSTYRYTQTVVRANGRQDRDPAPREQSADVFFVSVVR